MIAALALALASFQAPGITHTVPEVYVEGEPFIVNVEVSIPRDAPGHIPSWMIGSAGFVYNGRPLGRRDESHLIELAPGAELSIQFDLAPALEAEFQGNRRDFRISYGTQKVEATSVRVFQAAEQGIDFMTLPFEQLSDYQVVLRTSRGVIWAELWPDVAANHVRNYLDLCNTGFYDDSIFHRVIPSFMIQGGRAKTGSRAPRNVNAEFNTRPHVAGVLSMARGDNDINSAASEFFIVHGPSPHLDGNYSAFGKVLWGMEVVDAIAHAGNPEFRLDDKRSHRPPVDQVIEKAIVVKAKTPPVSDD